MINTFFNKNRGLDLKSVICERDQSQRGAVRDPTGNWMTGVFVALNRAEMLSVNKVRGKSGWR